MSLLITHSQVETDLDQNYMFSCWVKCADTGNKWAQISATVTTPQHTLTTEFLEQAVRDTYKITYTYGRTTFYGDEFWSVNMSGKDINDAYAQRIEWCTNTLGPSKVKSKIGRWYTTQVDNTHAALWFRSESDRTMFTLKWS